MTFRFTTQLIAVSLLAGAGYAVFCAFAFGMSDDVYIGHLHEFYSFGTRTTNATLRSTPYYYCLLAANSSATFLSLGSYATILAYMSSTKFTGKRVGNCSSMPNGNGIIPLITGA